MMTVPFPGTALGLRGTSMVNAGALNSCLLLKQTHTIVYRPLCGAFRAAYSGDCTECRCTHSTRKVLLGVHFGLLIFFVAVFISLAIFLSQTLAA